MAESDRIVMPDDRILVTGANGFIGSRVVRTLLDYGYKRIRCFVRPSSDVTKLKQLRASFDDSEIEFVKGNLLSGEDCNRATENVSLILHLAAGNEKTFSGCYLNSVVTTRNLLDSTLEHGTVKRFVNVSSFAVYSTLGLKRGGLLDESCELEDNSVERGDAYGFGKIKQDELVMEYQRLYGIPYVLVRPGAVYGPGKPALTGRVGIDTFGIFLHLGGSNRLPLTYVDNCAEIIVLSGIVAGIDNQVFNVVDSDAPTSRQFLRLYKQSVKRFRSVYVPYSVFTVFCHLWEKYSKWSEGQLPPTFNRRRCSATWKKVKYSNEKSRKLLGWQQRVSFEEGSRKYFDSLR